MTEEIIIDGVNVAGCEKLGETIDGITCGLGKRIRFANEIITKHNLCEDNPNCHYKQLKRLEQENKELKEQAQLDGECIDKLIEARDMYAKALEEIREICKCSKSPMNCDECPQSDNCEELCVNDENLQDIIYDKINEVLND